MRTSLAAVIAALTVILPGPAAAQDTRALAEAISAGIVAFPPDSMPSVLCIRLMDADRHDTAVPQALPGLVENRVLLARPGTPSPKILGGCGGGFGPDEGGGPSGAGTALTVSVRRGEDRPPEVWIDLAGAGWRGALTCSLPEKVRVTTELQSDCSPRAR